MKHLKEILKVWTDTRSIVIVAVVAAMYAALRLPFAAFQIIPGFTEIRPGAIVPPLAGILLGPAAAWGAAIGNTIGDIPSGFFGMGTLAGFVGNFLFAYVPYRIWRRSLRAHLEGAQLQPGKSIPSLVIIGIVGSLVCASTIAWLVDLMGLFPLVALGSSILFNNSIVCVILLPVLYPLLVPRMRRLRLVKPPPEERLAGRARSLVGLVMVVAGAAGVLTTAILMYQGGAGGLVDGTAGKITPVGAWQNSWWWFLLMLIGAALV